jgi:alpha-L-fucosidase
MDHFRIPPEEYSKMANEFNPQNFDPQVWAKLFKESGAKYVVIVSKHHDGFCLFDTEFTDYNVMNTPYGQDIIQQLKDACEAEGLKFGLYYSVIDWYHPDYLPRRYWDKRDKSRANITNYKTFFKNQVKELLSKYDPEILWFDGGWENTFNKMETEEITKMIYKLNPQILINNRLSNNAIGDFKTPEGYVPATGIKDDNGNPEIWETCSTMGDCWGYNPFQTNFYSSRDLIRMLIETTSKGGNLLLNVGPTIDGEIQPEFVTRLKDMGKWMNENNTAIYETNENIFSHIPYFGTTTTKNNSLYLHVHQKEKDNSIKLPYINNIQSISFLNNDQQLRYVKNDGFMTIYLPDKLPNVNSSTIEVTVKDEISFDKFDPKYSAATFTLTASSSEFTPINTDIKKIQYYDKIFVGNWDFKSKNKSIQWKFNLNKAAKYKMEIFATSRWEDSGDMKGKISINDEIYEKTITGLPKWTALNKALDSPNTVLKVELHKGENTISIQMPELVNNQVFILEKIDFFLDHEQ